jgi:CRP-like cAMP-binding protein
MKYGLDRAHERITGARFLAAFWLIAGDRRASIDRANQENSAPHTPHEQRRPLAGLRRGCHAGFVFARRLNDEREPSAALAARITYARRKAARYGIARLMVRRHPKLRPEDEALLKKSKLFGALTPELKARLLAAAEVVTFPPGTILWRRGGWPKYVYIALSGRVGLLDAAGDGATVIDLFPPGTAVGAASPLKGVPYLFTSRTLDEFRALRIPAKVFRRWLLTDHSLLLGTAIDMIDQWRRLTMAVHDLKQLSANQRLGRYLLALVDRKKGAATVRLKDDLVLLAGILGVTRESLSRSFAQLRKHGVTKRAKLVTIADVRHLRAYCESGSRP